MKFPLFKIESQDLRLFFREFLLGLIILAALITLNVFAATSTSPGSGGVLGQFEKAISKNIAEQLAYRMRVNEAEFQVEVENLKVRPALPQQESYSVQVLGLGALGSKRIDGLVTLQVLVDIPGTSQSSMELLVTGTLRIVGPVALTHRNVQRGETLKAEDIVYRILPWSTVPTSALALSISEISGRATRSALVSGQYLTREGVEDPAFVNTGEAVELTVYSGPGVIIRSKGIAKQSGKMGDSIRVEYSETKKSLMGLVIGKKSVEVRL